VKIDAAVRNPLDSYYRELERRRAVNWGLLLLGRHRPPASDLLSPNTYDHWLGVVLWHDVIRRLDRIQPSDDSMAGAWPSFLRVLAAADDLGAAPIAVEDLVGADAKARLLAIAQHVRTPVEDAACAELAARPLGRRVRSDLAVVAVHSRVAGSPDAVGLRCYVGVVEDDPSIEFELRVRDGRPHVMSRVWPAQFRLARSKTHVDQRAAAERLQQLEPPFRQRDDSYVRESVLEPIDGDLRDLVTEVVVNDVSQIIRTGIVDHNV
jgi:hypothetical protein